MKFAAYSALAVALLIAPSEGTVLTRRHHHHHGHEFVSTLPDVRADTVADTDIAAHEAARAEAAKVKKNPQAALLASIKADLEAINTNMSFGVATLSLRETTLSETCATRFPLRFWTTLTSSSARLNPDQTRSLLSRTPTTSPIIFYDVQLQDAMAGLGMTENSELVLAVNRLKSLQKLYLFEQKGGENYLG